MSSQGPRRQLLERAEGNAVGLAQGAIDGAGFGHPHFGIIEDEGGNIAGMSVAVANEASAFERLIDGSFENPEILPRLAEGEYRLRMDAATLAALCQA